MNKGKIIQIMGPVVDVAFPDELPAIKEALEVQLDGRRVKYRSMDELLLARRHVADQIAAASGRCSHHRFVFSTARGD